MSSSQLSSAQIARKAKSNLAFALGCLSKERKRDMITFYAFCRVVDDIADDTATNEEDKERELSHWKKCVLEGTPPGHSVLDEALDAYEDATSYVLVYEEEITYMYEDGMGI